MISAQAELTDALKKISTRELICDFIPNVTGVKNSNLPEICDLLGRQLVSSVCWTETMSQLTLENLTHVIEMGPGKVLKGLAKSCGVPVVIQPFGVLEDIDTVAKNFEGVIHA